MNRFLLFGLLFCCSLYPLSRAAAQDTLSIDFSHPVNGVDTRTYTWSFTDRTGRLTAENLPQTPFYPDSTIFHPRKKALRSVNNVWLNLKIRNSGQVDSLVYLFTGWHDDISFYTTDAAGKPTLQMHTGLMVDRGDVERWNHYTFPLHVRAGETRTFYVHILNRFYRENEFLPVLYDPIHKAEFHHTQTDQYKGEVLVIQILIGMLLVLLSITVINYTQLPDRSSLYFAAYLLGLILFFTLRLETKPFQLSFFHFCPMFKFYWDIPALLFCFYFMYMLFGNMFLSLRERYPLMEKIYRYGAMVTGILILVCIAMIAMGNFQAPAMIYTWTYFITLIPFGISFIALARRTRHHPLIRFYLFGSISLYLLTIWAFLNNNEPVSFTPLPELVGPYNVLVLGVLLQALFFAAGLSYRNKLVHQEKTKTQEMLIKQLNKNKELQRKLNEQLEELVKEQTTEILRKKMELEEQRKLQLDVEYSKKLAEIELKAIRAQINPHFIFNCLNSIQLFVMQRDYEHAQKYLSDFSYLIRKTLDFSRRNFITLADEITYLNTYLGLEKMRFEQKMSYEILTDPSIATAELEVPAMLLQPYVENAVKHGMINEDHSSGLLVIRFNMLAGDMLECVIEDNGIGIERSRALRSLPGHHQSQGMEISLNRAELLNKMYNTGIQIEIIDKSKKQANDSGTVIRVLIPQL
ncbi:histidine kinase [Chitinophaga barathri]|uniref:Histidine kinase n=1 Tax=Chitinophaga barathri TaxID=1647451 RepID=A0A3N4M9K1_9BACT|nr:histidine kinase [Chitinophaga barathri]RPD40404.1 hypothetical protein EG028_13940 [Chitinophaga barathri]